MQASDPKPASGSTSGCGRRASSRRARWPPKRSARGRVIVNGQAAKAVARGPDRRHARACARARCRGPSSSLGVSAIARAGAGRPGAVRGDGGERRRPRGRRPGAPPDAGAGGGASSRAARPSATAASSPTGTAGAPRSTATEADCDVGRESALLKCKGMRLKSLAMTARTTSAPPDRRRPGPGRRRADLDRPLDRGRQRRGRRPHADARRRRPRSPARRAVRRLPARQGRGREHPPPRRGRGRQGAQVRGRGLRREPAAGEGQPGSGDRHPGRHARAAARRRARHAAPAERRRSSATRCVEINPPAGTKFDPHQHQAISVVPAEQEPNTVVAVLQKGYLIADRVLRPALVTVAAPRSLTAAAALKHGRVIHNSKHIEFNLSGARTWQRSSASTSAPPTRAWRSWKATPPR